MVPCSSLPSFIRDQLRGIMVVATPEEMPRVGRGQRSSALSSQVALALESAALTEDLLRRQSEARFASLVQNSSDVVTVVDAGLDDALRQPVRSSAVLGLRPERARGHAAHATSIHPEDKTRASCSSS